MAIELVVSDWNGTLFRHTDDARLLRKIAYAAFRGDLRALARGRLQRLRVLLRGLVSARALGRIVTEYRAGRTSLSEMYELYNRRVLRGRRVGLVVDVARRYATENVGLVDVRMLRPLRAVHEEGVSTAVLSAGYDVGIRGVLTEAGFDAVFDHVFSNVLEAEGDVALGFTSGFLEDKVGYFKAEFLDSGRHRPEGVVYVGDSANDEPIAGLLPAGSFIVPFLAADEFKQRMALRHGAFVPGSEEELLAYLRAR